MRNERSFTLILLALALLGLPKFAQAHDTCDVNFDGVVDGRDANYLVKYINGVTTSTPTLTIYLPGNVPMETARRNADQFHRHLAGQVDR